MELLFAIALLVASAVLGSFLQQKPTDAKPAALGDFNFPQSDEKTPQQIIFGDVWTEDWQVLWYGNLGVTALHNAKGKK